MSYVTHLSCPKCGARYDHRIPQNVCTCGSPLLVEYDLRSVDVTTEQIASRAPTMWRYAELLPCDGDPVSLGEGFTPLLWVDEFDCFVKDEGLNPTGSFKARGASCGVTRARELGITEVALPTAGNAGGAWACYGAAAGMKVHVAMPNDAPELNKTECRAFGADLTLVDGLISDAGALIARGVAEQGWFDAATLREPYRIEGKKTLGLEIAEQLSWSMPDAIVYPAGGGVGIIGIWRALQQLQTLGWVDGELPRLVIVQAEGCAPLVRAFENGTETSEFWPRADTVAAGLRVPKALGDFLVLRAVGETNGCAIAVGDAEIVRAMRALASRGILAAPEGAATLAGLHVLRARGDIVQGDRVVLINTGSALKYPEVLASSLDT